MENELDVCENGTVTANSTILKSQIAVLKERLKFATSELKMVEIGEYLLY